MKRPQFLRRPDFAGRRHFWLGILGAVVIIVLVAGSVLYASAGVGEQTVKADFAQAAGLQKGDPVKVAGIDVGKVSGLALERDHVQVSMNVHASVKLGPDARAAIKVSTLLGAHYVDLSPGDGSGLPKGRIQQTNTAVPYNLADVIQVGTPKFEALDANKLAATLNVINAQLGSSAPLAAQALDSVGALSKEINSRRDQFDSLLRNLSTVTSILSDDRADLLTLITQGDRIGARIMQREQLVRQLLDTTAELTRELQQIGAQNNGKIGPTIRELDVISQGLQKNKDNLDRLLQIMPVAARQYNNASGDGNYTNLYMPWGLFPDNWLCFAQVVPGCK